MPKTQGRATERGSQWNPVGPRRPRPFPLDTSPHAGRGLGSAGRGLGSARPQGSNLQAAEQALPGTLSLPPCWPMPSEPQPDGACPLAQHWPTQQAQQSRRLAEERGQGGLWEPHARCVRKSLDGQRQHGGPSPGGTRPADLVVYCRCCDGGHSYYLVIFVDGTFISPKSGALKG